MIVALLTRIAFLAAIVALALLAVFSVHLVLSGGNPRKAYAGFRKSMDAFGAFMGRAILTVFYFTVFVPFALVARAKDPMRMNDRGAWIPRKTRDLTLADLRKQY